MGRDFQQKRILGDRRDGHSSSLAVLPLPHFVGFRGQRARDVAELAFDVVPLERVQLAGT